MEDEVVSAELGLAIGDERLVAEAGQEAQGREAMAERLTIGKVRHIQPANRDRQRIRIVELDKVIQQRSDAAGEPFVDAQRGLASDRCSGVRRADRGNAQSPMISCHPADGEIGQLQTEFHRVQHRTAIRRRVEQVESLAILIEAESKMEPGRAVGIGRDQREVTTCRDGGAGGKHEAIRRIQVIGQAQTGKIRGGGARVEKLDEIRKPAIDRGRADVAGEHFIDHHATLPRENGPGARQGRRALGLPHARRVASNHINRVAAIGEAGEFDGRGNGCLGTVSAAVDPMAIVSDAHTAHLERGGVLIGRADGHTDHCRLDDDWRRRKRCQGQVHPVHGDCFHRVESAGGNPVAEDLIDQREKVVGVEQAGQLVAIFGVVERFKFRMPQEAVHIRNVARLEEARSVGAAGTAEDGIEVVRHDDEARIENAAVHVVVVIKAIGEGRLAVIQEIVNGEVTHPQPDIHIAADSLNILIVRRGIRIERVEQVNEVGPVVHAAVGFLVIGTADVYGGIGATIFEITFRPALGVHIAVRIVRKMVSGKIRVSTLDVGVGAEHGIATLGLVHAIEA